MLLGAAFFEQLRCIPNCAPSRWQEMYGEGLSKIEYMDKIDHDYVISTDSTVALTVKGQFSIVGMGGAARVKQAAWAVRRNP
eukprot:9485656-Pyramimonas_sp.AAC.1